MKMHYRLGWPFSRFFAKCGIPIHVQLDVIHDEEAGVFVGTSKDIRGLVVEADTLENLAREAKLLIPDMLQADQCAPNVHTDLRFQDRIIHA